jgi:chromosome segregation ATPase
VQSLVDFAEELERRDAALAQTLAEIERLQREVDELRTHAAATAERLAALPAALAAADAGERAARTAVEDARAAVRSGEAALERARRDDERLAAERDLQHARDELHAAEERAAGAVRARERLVRDGDAYRLDAERLAARAVELGGRVRDVPEPDAGLNGAIEWALRARGALLLEQSSLVREREMMIREASELLGGVLGDPLTTTAATGIRDRLARALRDAAAQEIEPR